jgi:GNAT superfamily N-acetyltransferase
VAFEIRAAEADDLDAILELIEELEAAQEPWRVFPRRSTVLDEIRTRYAEAIAADGPDRLWVALVDGVVVGTAFAHALVPSAVSDEEAVELGGVFVRPEHRGQGIARALTAESARFARARGARRITIKVFAQNRDALVAWERLGFEPRMLQMTIAADRLGDEGDRKA